jgi:hypothetical protein
VEHGRRRRRARHGPHRCDAWQCGSPCEHGNATRCGHACASRRCRDGGRAGPQPLLERAALVRRGRTGSRASHRRPSGGRGGLAALRSCWRAPGKGGNACARALSRATGACARSPARRRGRPLTHYTLSASAPVARRNVAVRSAVERGPHSRVPGVEQGDPFAAGCPPHSMVVGTVTRSPPPSTVERRVRDHATGTGFFSVTGPVCAS